ncbi:hypothetical protein Hanom_Chr07g00627851 [Helianthus anomalus]
MWYNRDPNTIFFYLETFYLIHLKKESDPATISMRSKAYDLFGLWTWRIVIHSNCLESIGEQYFHFFILHLQSFSHKN